MFSANAVRQLARTAAKTSGRTAFRAISSKTARFGPCALMTSSVTPFSYFANHQVAFKSTQAQDSDTSGRDAYQVSQTIEGTDACQKIGLDKLGITNLTTLYRNLSYQELFDHEVKNNEGVVVKAEYGDTFAVGTGKFTGRSPKDRFIVKNPGSKSEAHIDWNDVNMPGDPAVYDELFEKAVAHYNSKENAYVFDGYCGARKDSSQLKVRFIVEMAWQQHFVTNMFIRPQNSSELEGFEPDFTVINACSQVNEEWERHGVHSDTTVMFDIERKTAVIFGTWYGGEMKKGIFSLMNYLLPMAEKPMFPMHCSANVGKDGDVALFFGLSGTGKTTLSADPHRALIGDDEHGWDDKGIFNFEGGCYAKTINLSEKTEPDIYRAIKTDALLENVTVNPDGTPNYSDTSKTENGRVSYPLFHIPGYHKEQVAGHPKNVIFLSCDAFGVLPAVARLTPGQAMYHFLSGYTAKVAGTERGITEPVATFSTCFGAAFMTLHPTVYADILKEKMETYGSNVYLVNSGWAGGPYGEGERMSIKATRTCIDAILDGSIENAEFEPHPVFGFDVPKALHDVDPGLLDIKSTWAHPENYDAAAKNLASMYVENFKKYEGKGSVDYTQYGPQV